MSSGGGGLDLSTREIASLLNRARKGEISGAEIDDLWNRIPQDAKVDFLAFMFEERVIPHVRDIKARADAADPAQVRDVYAAQDPDTKDDLLREAVGDVVATVAEIRENPERGLLNLKEIIRDPHTTEALLLVFDDAEHIDPEYSEQAKDFASWYLTAIGVALLPELYDAGTVEEVYDAFGLSTDRDPHGDDAGPQN